MNEGVRGRFHPPSFDIDNKSSFYIAKNDTVLDELEEELPLIENGDRKRAKKMYMKKSGKG